MYSEHPPPVHGGEPRGLPRRSRKGPIWTIVVGVLAGIAGFVLLLLGAVVGIGSAAESQAQQLQLESGVEHAIGVEPGTSYALFIHEGTGIRCDAATPGGRPLEIHPPRGNITLTDRVLAGTVDATDSIRLTCETSDGHAFFFGDSLAASLGGMPGLVIGGVLLMGAGFVLTVGGIIWLAVRSAQISAARDLGDGTVR